MDDLVNINPGTTTTTSGVAPTPVQVPNSSTGATTAYHGLPRPTYTAPTGINAPHFVNGQPLTPTTIGTPFQSTASGINTLQSGVRGMDNANFSTFSMAAPIDYNYAGRGATYAGPVARVDPTLLSATVPNNGGFNHLLLNLPPTFERLIQEEVIAHPTWWHDRIPRGAFQLFNGTTLETTIFRGGLYKTAGLDEWTDINPVPSATNNPCGTGEYSTVQYGWERLISSGMRRYWGSDPICLDALKFSPKVQQQLAMILAVGAKEGIQIQEVWNRDMFVYQSVQFNRSFVMTTQFNGPTDSPRYFYNPFIKFDAAKASANSGAGTPGYADPEATNRLPFIVFEAVDVEPLNFDVLDQVRQSLKIRCPGAAVSRASGEPVFGLAVSYDDIERYIRGNEEERKYWIENDPAALIQHYGFAPSTFRKWAITNDNNQLRFKLWKYIPGYNAAKAAPYGGVGIVPGATGANTLDGKNVWVAVYVPPLKASEVRVGIGGSVIPEDNPEYYKAEIAIAPIFMNQVFTNLFVPSVTTLGSGTHFGPVTGLNGNWGWTNYRDSTNPEGNVGKFFGKFEIVPRYENCVVHATSFLYRRCTTPLPSLCPVDNPKVNLAIDRLAAVKVAETAEVTAGTDYLVTLTSGMAAGAGDVLDIAGTSWYVVEQKTPVRYRVVSAGGQSQTAPAAGDAVSLGVYGGEAEPDDSGSGTGD